MTFELDMMGIHVAHIGLSRWSAAFHKQGCPKGIKKTITERLYLFAKYLFCKCCGQSNAERENVNSEYSIAHFGI